MSKHFIMSAQRCREIRGFKLVNGYDNDKNCLHTIEGLTLSKQYFHLYHGASNHRALACDTDLPTAHERLCIDPRADKLFRLPSAHGGKRRRGEVKETF
jgi:hypothetical protein